MGLVSFNPWARGSGSHRSPLTPCPGISGTLRTPGAVSRSCGLDCYGPIVTLTMFDLARTVPPLQKTFSFQAMTR